MPRARRARDPVDRVMNAFEKPFLEAVLDLADGAELQELIARNYKVLAPRELEHSPVEVGTRLGSGARVAATSGRSVIRVNFVIHASERAAPLRHFRCVRRPHAVWATDASLIRGGRLGR